MISSLSRVLHIRFDFLILGPANTVIWDSYNIESARSLLV